MQSKFDNDFKAKILEEKLDRRVAEIKKECYKRSKYINVNDDGVVEQIASPLWCEWLKVNKANPRYDCAIRLNDSKQRKAKRVKDKIRDLVMNSHAIFITLTFTDDVIAKTSPITRRRYVARYLKETSPIYVANVDYSPTKHREHYHAIIMNRADFDKWQYGFVFGEQIRNHDYDVARTSKYVAKLTSHALKTGLTTRLIYSRDTL